ncbi:MAG: TonB-dependent receptor plug domain-containing protein [Gammaproteobacteria bacterium]
MHRLTASLVTLLLFPSLAAAQDQGFSMELANLDIEELMNIQISSVSRRAENLSGATASVFVITSDDIRRSGASSVPEILRMAPNLQVARVNAYEYAITARGFNNRVGNKLLVMQDGRTLYTPMFSGVFWEMQDANLEDIERIEVISGPGGTLWGANAVNGVINIITRNASQTQSTLVSATAGNYERGATVRTGGSVGALAWRAYGKASEWDHTWLPTGAAGVDGFERQLVGFRADHDAGRQQFSLQGEVMQAESQDRGVAGTIAIPPVELKSRSLQANWNRELRSGSEVSVQAYYTYSMRDEFVLFSPESSIFDIEANHHMKFEAGRETTHDVVWGGGMRRAYDDVEPGFFTIYIPKERNLDWQNLFIQDEISLGRNLRVVPGIKFEWNDYTGREHLPSLSVAWQADAHLLWASWSRVIRAPSRFDRDVYYPERPPFLIAGGPNFQAEVAHVVETGLRGQPTSKLSYSLTLFHYDWDKLRSATAPPFPLYLVNTIEGNTYGVEAWATWQITPKWQVRGGFNTLEKSLGFGTDAPDTVGVDNPTLHNDPDYQWQLRTRYDLRPNIQMDLQLRRVAELSIESVPSYTELDLRVGWQPTDKLELSLTGANLLHKRHAEYSAPANRNLINRSVAVGLRWML